MSKKSTNVLGEPFLRWAGSKRQLIPELSRYWDKKYDRYVEPFAGSASLFFNIYPKSAILGDINQELILTYKQIKRAPNDVIIALKLLNKGKRNYLELRSINPRTLPSNKRAARFIYLNRFCFNGLYRTNQKGQFNVPYSGNRTGGLPSSRLLLQCSKALQIAELLHGNFDVSLKKVKKGDFVYMDPPYSVNATRVFNEYDPSSFNNDHLDLLKKWMIKLDRNGVTFLVSYADSEEGDFLGKGFNKRVIEVRRNIAGFSANRRRTKELLISNVKPKPIGGINVSKSKKY